MSLADELQRLGVTVGRVVAVEPHAGARAPSYLITVDLGPQGRHQTSVPSGDRQPEDLEGTQVICARDEEEIVVLAAHSHAHGLVFLRPERDVEEGSVVA